MAEGGVINPIYLKLISGNVVVVPQYIARFCNKLADVVVGETRDSPVETAVRTLDGFFQFLNQLDGLRCNNDDQHLDYERELFSELFGSEPNKTQLLTEMKKIAIALECHMMLEFIDQNKPQ